jgi:PKD repeat protein
MAALKHKLLKLWWVLPLFLIFIQYQNCAPMQFSKKGQSNAPSSADPLSPLSLCAGFSVNQVTSVVIPTGQTSVNVTMTGTLGSAPAPMEWLMNGTMAGTGLSQTVSVSAGDYTITARSTGGACSQTFAMRVSSASCVPSATQIVGSLESSPPYLINTNVRVQITNLSQLNNVLINWGDGTVSSVTATPVSHQYTVSDQYSISLTAKEKNCNSNLTLTMAIITVTAPSPSPSPSASPTARPSASPSASPSPSPTPACPTGQVWTNGACQCQGVIKDPTGCLVASCSGGVSNPQVRLQWCTAGAEYQVQKADMYPNDPNMAIDYLPNDRMAQVFIDSWAIQGEWSHANYFTPGVTYQYRVKYSNQNNTVLATPWVSVPITSCSCGN